jgi:hypothetical protein
MPRVFRVPITITLWDRNATMLRFMPPVLAVAVTVVTFYTAVITVTLRAPLVRCPDPGIVAVVRLVPLSIPRRLVLLPMTVVFFIWAIVWRTYGDVVTKVSPHARGQRPCANPVIVLMVDVDVCARIVIGADRRIVPVVVINHSR